MSDFLSQFQSVSDFVGNAARGVLSKLDQITFKMLVNNLKSNDYDVVAESIDQLVREKKPIKIPPLYFVARAHPNEFVRRKAGAAIKGLDEYETIEKLTAGKSIEEATHLLIERYGNFRA